MSLPLQGHRDCGRQGAFVPRFIVELHSGASADYPTRLTLTYSGAPLEAGIQFVFAGGEAVDQQVKATSYELPELAALQSATIRLPATRANEIKVLAHQIMPEGHLLALPITAEFETGDSIRQVYLRETGGQVTLPLDHQVSQLTVTLRKKTS